jgi:L-lysine 6-transaminase
MYELTVSPELVNEALSKHILADGFDLTYDIEPGLLHL